MAAGKPRLLFVGSFVTNHREQGGMNGQCRQIIGAMSERVDFVLLDSTPPYLPAPPLPWRMVYAARRVGALIRAVLRERLDAALIFSSGGVSFLEKGLMTLLARAGGVPVIWSVRAGVFRHEVEGSALFASTARLLLMRSNRILCQGESWARFYRDRFGIPAERLFVLQNWIAASSFLAIPRIPERAGPFRLLFVGHVKREKGVFELVDVLLASPELLDVEADLVGDGEALDELRRGVRARDATARVRFHGWRVGPDLLRLFEVADALVLPSYAEGFPNVVLEAMAAGLPVIVTSVGAVPDVVTHGRNGLLIAPRDPGALAGAIAALEADPATCWRMGQHNRVDILAHSVDSAAARLWRELAAVSRAFADPVVTGENPTVPSSNPAP